MNSMVISIHCLMRNPYYFSPIQLSTVLDIAEPVPTLLCNCLAHTISFTTSGKFFPFGGFCLLPDDWPERALKSSFISFKYS